MSNPCLHPAPLALAIALTLASYAALTPAHAQAVGAPISITLPAQPLGTALNELARQARLQLMVHPDLVAGRTAPPVSGQFTVREALERLLSGSGLTADIDGEEVIVRKAHGGPQESALPPVKVSAQRAKDGTTEGSGSYTTRATRSATRLAMSLRETPQSISVITRQRIEDENLNNIETLLDRTPGVSVQNMGTSRYQILSRGYAIDSYQIDGILTSTDVGTQNMPQSQSDLVIFDRVEVLRGSTGLLSGAGDPSGTINLVRKKPTHEFQGHASAGIGNWDRYRAEVDVAGPLNATGSIRGRLVGAREEGGSHLDYFKQKKTVLYGLIEADLSPGTLLTVGMDYQDNDPRGTSGNGLPLFYTNGQQTRFDPSTNASARWSRSHIESHNTFLSLEHRFANEWVLKLSANQMDGKREFFSAGASSGLLDQATGNVKLYGGQGSAVQRQTGFDAQIQGPFEWFGRRHDFVLGFNWSEYQNHHQPLLELGGLEGRTVNFYQWHNDTATPVTSGAKLFDYDIWQKQYGTYSTLRFKPLDDLALILGARLSSYESSQSLVSSVFNITGGLQRDNILTPYAGVVYDIDKTHSVYASYTSIFRAQSNRDRTGKVLAPREGNNYEAGLKSEFLGGRLNTAVAVYQIRQDNLAVADAGQTVPGTTPPEAAYRAVKGAKTQGLDVEVSGELLSNLQVGLSYNYSTTEDADGDRISTTFPRNMAKLWGTYRLPGDLNKLTLGGGLNWQDRISYTTTSSALPGIALTARQQEYAVLNLMARYQVTPKLSASVNLNNVFDKAYLQGLDASFNTAIYAPTRNVMLNLKYQF